MAKKAKKPGIIEQLFGSLIKLLFSGVGCIVVAFILLTGSFNFNVSFSKDQLKSVTLLERIGNGFKIVKNGYSVVESVIK